jgi:hypothetical protein
MSVVLVGVASVGTINGQNSTIKVKITNHSKLDVFIRQYLGKLNYIDFLTFNGKHVQPIDIGIRARMRAIEKSDYFLINPGETIEVDVRISGNSNHSKNKFFLTEKLCFMTFQSQGITL